MQQHTAAPLQHVGQYGAGHPDVSQQVQLQDVPPVVVPDAEEASRPDRGHSRVVVQDVDAPEAVERRLDEPPGPVGVAQVGLDRQHPVVAQCRERCRIEVAPHHGRPFLQECAGRGETDSVARACDENDLSREIVLHGFLSLPVLFRCFPVPDECVRDECFSHTPVLVQCGLESHSEFTEPSAEGGRTPCISISRAASRWSPVPPPESV
ncbi:hypothetical protein QWJ26_03920 [Streptomyces sp. CSDS2]|nr:hypothetical protein [Streptomyces sp. CSDS2]MDN3258965.1 hypothetical protein [Streptomyces sp. CSDS2]